MQVSVIIPTRNRAGLLSKVLESLGAQTMDPESFEVIVVDNGSTDLTSEVCQNAADEIGNLRYAYDARPGLHVGRHVGLEIAGAEILLYGDDDIVASPTWVEGVVAAFSDPAVGIVGGPCRPNYEVSPPSWVEHLVEGVPGGWYVGEFSLLDLGPEPRTMDPGLAFGCNFGARKRLVEEVGGFHPDALPEEFLRYRGDGETAVAEGIARLGYGVVYSPEAAVAHFVAASRLTMDYVESRSYAEGVLSSYRAIRSGQSFRSPLLSRARTVRKRLRATMASPEVVRRRWRAHVSGYMWHQGQARSDPDLVEWVRRPTYFGSQGDIPRAGG